MLNSVSALIAQAANIFCNKFFPCVKCLTECRGPLNYDSGRE